VISGFRREVAENYALLSYYVASSVDSISILKGGPCRWDREFAPKRR